MLCVGKVSTSWIQKGIEQFEKRIHRYLKFSTNVLPDIKNVKSLSKESIKEEEGKIILGALNSSDYVVLMDERGKEFTSTDFADWIQKQMNASRKRIVFVIGGPYGFSSNVYSRADFLFSLSKMTYTHEFAKLVLTEQLYRGFSILNGEPYHHE